jgi:pimeloyl-ACP methyl ester carboxylesterase
VHVPWEVRVERDGQGVPPRYFFADADNTIGGTDLMGLLDMGQEWPDRLQELVAGELGLIVPQRDPVAMWGRDAVGLFQAAAEESRATVGGRVTWDDSLNALNWLPNDSDDFSMYFEAPTTLALALDPGQSYFLRYIEAPEVRRPEVLADPWLTWDQSFKYVAYSVGDTGGLQAWVGETPINSLATARLDLPDWMHPTRLIGRVASRYSRWRNEPKEGRSDPAFTSGSRARELLQDPAVQALASDCPTLSGDNPSTRADRVVVFVHGTGSTCYRYLPELSYLRGRLYLFEHDTYIPIDQNAHELAALVRVALPHADVAFVGHSRGGLVARSAAGKLAASGRESNVLTLGTPHAGCELVPFAEQTVNGGIVRRSIQRALIGLKTLVSRHAGSAQDEMFKELLSMSPLPEGFRDMTPNCSTLGQIVRLPRPQQFFSVGASIDPRTRSLSSHERLMASIIAAPKNSWFRTHRPVRRDVQSWATCPAPTGSTSNRTM